MSEKIVKRIIEHEMQQSYLDYAMSVIVGRALPDVKDGLKPVHRRVLFAMQKMGIVHNKPFRKCARIVGEVLGKYHPHGDSAVYDTLVRMAQGFSLRYPLVQGQGNFGSVDGDSAAAMRYTEARLSKISEPMLLDIQKETVEFKDNFDNSLKEPVVLPAKVPNLLINGSSGIAVGMATNIPPHNLSEVSDAVIAQIDNSEITIDQLNKIIKGPDFPTAGIIVGQKGIIEAYKKGKGRIKVRARSEITEVKKKPVILISEIPYMVNKAGLIKQIADCVKSDRVKGIRDLRDESDRNGMRIVIFLKRDANAEVVLNQLYKHTRLQTTFGANMLALVNKEPKQLTLKQFISHFIDHRKTIIVKRTQYDLRKAQARIHIVKGLLIALKNIDPIIKLIKGSDDANFAIKAIQENYELSEKQAESILRMRLQRLTALEIDKLKAENKGLEEKIKGYKSILASNQRVLEIIKQETIEIKNEFGDERITNIIEDEGEILDEDIIKEEQMVVTITNSGYIKRTKPELYKVQHRGGKGIIAASTKESDFVEHVFTASTHSYILFFTDKGKVYWVKVYHLPHASRQAKGKAIVNLLRLEKDEQITAMIPIRDFKNQEYLVMVTKNGTVNKTELEAYSNPRKGGIIAIKLQSDDELVDVVKTEGSQELIIGTAQGQAVRFRESDVRSTGRSTQGVKGITLGRQDYVVGMVLGDKEKTLLSITENGYGKRTKISKYRLIRRGGKGVINIKCSRRNGKVVDIKTVNETDELMLVSKNGILIRVPVSGVSEIGRNTQGVRIMRLNAGDKVINAAQIAQKIQD
ncbi:MAG: DNA gyrase subunit A [Candidatus Woesearchaeota archaeon]|nr:DNA gyrase subunit A [Candidatus Woesearchaeota archaeon]